MTQDSDAAAGEAGTSERGPASPADAVIEKLTAKFKDSVFEALVDAGDRSQAAVVVAFDQWPQVAKWLAGETEFSFLSDLSAVDRPRGVHGGVAHGGVDEVGAGPRFEVVYVLTDLEAPARLRVKVRIDSKDDDPPKLQSVAALWPTADWLEREAYDMFGIVFEGHPDLRRILMPDEWEGHPLRKDYSMGKVPVEYKHLSPGF